MAARQMCTETGDGERRWWAAGLAGKQLLTWACMLISQPVCSISGEG